MLRYLLILPLLFLVNPLNSQIVINEYSSSNSKVVQDEDGDFPDWIELYNPTDIDVHLGGFHLSDNATSLFKWTFPDITLNQKSYMLVFASGKDRSLPPLSYRTIIDIGSTWNYLIPTSDIGTSWRNIGYDASGWSSGPSGFGYGDNDDATVLNSFIISVFVRKEFEVSNLNDVADFVLSIDYDDSFVAFINGKEIARNNLGAAGSAVPFNMTATAQREATMYSGGLPETYRIANPAEYLVEGTNVIAIQCHNTNSSSSDLSLIPILTLGLNGSGYTDNHPPYVSVTGNQLHTNFSISSSGEGLYLTGLTPVIIDSVPPLTLLPDISYGRKPDGQNSWYYFASPTPLAPNTTKGYDSETGDSVKFSYGGGYFPGGLIVSLSANDPLDTIYYTLDGSNPGPGKTRYTHPIEIRNDAILKARSFNSNKLPSATISNTYYTTPHSLPVVCLSTDPLNLWDNDSGIYVMGPNASPDSPFFGANFWQDWERPANMEVYDINGIKQVDQGVGIRIYGSYSRANAQKSLAVYARSEYGKGSFDYSFFKDKPITSYESIVLRNSGNDWNGSVMRDGIASELVKGMDVERQAFQPSIVYINGAYWGILNMREKINSYFIAENHFVDPAKVNILEGNGTVTEGSNADYLPIISYLNVNTLESEEKYLKATEHIDINNYIQYQLSEIYLNNKDWPGNNIKFWNTNDPDFHWRWILYDTDFGLNLWESIAYTYNTLEFALDPSGPGWPNPPWATLMFRRMVTNPDFRYNFITQFADRLNTNFESKRAVALVDSVKNLFMPEIDMHLARWGMDFNFWYGQVGNIKSFVNYRAGYMRNFLRSQFGLGITMNVKIIISSPGAGKVLLNTVIPNVYPFTGVYFQNLPIKLTALPADGYKFVRWEGSINSNAVSVDYDMSASPTITAVFEPASASDVNIVINEINYDSSPDKDTRDWIELYNAGIASVNLKNWVISDGGIETGFKFPNDLILYPDNYLVVAREMSAFRAVRPEISNLSGDFGFGLGNAGDDINLFNSNGNIEDWVNYTNNSPWPSGANATGASIELVNPLADNNIGSNWKLSSSGGTPGAINANSFPLEIPENIKDEKSLLDCFPNPFSDYTTVRIVVPGAADYKLEVYDLQGRLIKVLADEFISAGTYYIDWEGKDSNNSKLPGGFYIIRLSGFNQVMNLKVILTR